ncbi:hypothetical protein I317_00004 [Kwoniella heveanensis CBS 569]|nr:hypothetical protein I317_00004 [Kwoniella heveanensis CBS 569]
MEHPVVICPSTLTRTCTRTVSLHERFSLARRNAGYPPIIVIAVAYPTSSALPTTAFLSQRVVRLQRHFPSLWSRIDGERTTKPRLVQLKEPWSPEDILSTGAYTPALSTKEKVNDDGRNGRDEEFETILKAESDRMGNDGEVLRSSPAPAWQVRIHTPASSSSTRAYLTLAVDHVYTDGRGILSLLQALLAPGDISTTSPPYPYEKLSAIPKVEDTLPMKPSVGYILPLIFQKIVLPMFPHFIQNYLKPISPWPAKVIREAPLRCSPGLSVYSVPASEVTAVKTLSKEKGIPTLHGLFKTALVGAIWAVYRHTTTEPKFIVSASTPRSERDPALGHPYCMGNYISSHKIHLELAASQDFWALAKKVSDDLLDPRAISHGRMGMGSLAFVPDGELDGGKDPRKPTKWEEFFLNGAASAEPFGESANVSNLGVCKLPEGAEDLVWGQYASPFTAALCIAMIGHEGGLRLVTTWREGSAVIESETKEVERAFHRILKRLIDAQKDTSLAALAL